MGTSVERSISLINLKINFAVNIRLSQGFVFTGNPQKLTIESKSIAGPAMLFDSKDPVGVSCEKMT